MDNSGWSTETGGNSCDAIDERAWPDGINKGRGLMQSMSGCGLMASMRRRGKSAANQSAGRSALFPPDITDFKPSDSHAVAN